MDLLATHTLSEGQIRQLQWLLPTQFSARFVGFFKRTAAMGAKLRFRTTGGEHWIGFFEIERMVDEALRCPRTTVMRFPNLLPFAGCGRRRAAVYLVDVVDLSVWQLEPGQEPTNLGVTLEAIWACASVEPRVVVRRRLPTCHQKGTPRQARGTIVPDRTERPCARTLSLFPA